MSSYSANMFRPRQGLHEFDHVGLLDDDELPQQKQVVIVNNSPCINNKKQPSSLAQAFTIARPLTSGKTREMEEKQPDTNPAVVIQQEDKINEHEQELVKKPITASVDTSAVPSSPPSSPKKKKSTRTIKRVDAHSHNPYSIEKTTLYRPDAVVFIKTDNNNIVATPQQPKFDQHIKNGDDGAAPPINVAVPPPRSRHAETSTSAKTTPNRGNLCAERKKYFRELNSLHKPILGKYLPFIPWAATKSFYDEVCLGGTDDRLISKADQEKYHSILIGQACLAQNAKAIRYLIKLLTGIDCLGLPLVFPASYQDNNSINSRTNKEKVIKAGFVKVWCKTKQEALTVIAALHNRVLIDENGAWYAENEEQIVELHCHCTMLKNDIHTRYQHRPFAPLTASLCLPNLTKAQQGSNYFYNSLAGATGYCQACARFFHNTPTQIDGFDRNILIQMARDEAEKIVQEFNQAPPPSLPLPASASTSANSNHDDDDATETASVAPSTVININNNDSPQLWMKVYEVSDQNKYRVKNATLNCFEEHIFPLLSVGALYHCKKAVEENWSRFANLTLQNSNDLRIAAKCGRCEHYE